MASPGRRAATLGATHGPLRCKLNGVNPEAYLADLIGRVGDHPASRIDELLPWNWSAQVV